MEAQAKANETGEQQRVYDKEQKRFIKLNPINVRVKVRLRYLLLNTCFILILRIRYLKILNKN